MVLQPLLHAARRLAAARPEARRFAARAWVGAPLVRASLALVGLRTTLRWIEAAPPGRRGKAPVGVEEGRALVRGAFRFHVVAGACLHQSLVQVLLHRRDGLAVRLVLGVKRPDTSPGIAAHAWVEGIDGEACRPDDPSFAPIFVSAPASRDASVAEVPGAWSTT